MSSDTAAPPTVYPIVLDNFKVGVELESQLPPEVVSNHVRFDKGWTHHREHCGSEVVSPVLYGFKGIDELKAQLKNLCKVARNTIGFENCGLHVHVDIQDLNLGNVKRLLRLGSMFNETIYGIMPGSRYKNRYCYHPDYSVNAIESCDSLQALTALQKKGRYYGINLLAFAEHGTVEFRYGQGTFHWPTIYALVHMYLSMVFWAKSPNTLPIFQPSLLLSNKRKMDEQFKLFMDTIQVDQKARKVLTSMYDKNWNRTKVAANSEPNVFEEV